MSFFTAILVHTADGYRCLDLEVEEAASIDELSELMGSAGEEHESIAVIEHEDEWFALVRRTVDADMRVFLSNIGAVAESRFSELFADYLDTRRVDEYEPEDEDDEAEDEQEDFEEFSDDEDDFGEAEFDEARLGSAEFSEAEFEDAEFGAAAVSGSFVPDESLWGGDADIFADRGVSAEELIDQVERYPSDPARVVAHVGEAVGFADRLEAAR